MSIKIKIISFVIFFILVIAGVGFYFWQDWQNSQISQKESLGIKQEESLGIKESSDHLDIKRPSDEFQGVVSENQMPDLSRNIPKSASNEDIEQIKVIIQTLKDNSDYLQGWLQLGILRKKIGDWEGAAQAWKFAAIIRPDNSVAYLNLGDLYGYYFHDNQKAEENLLKAIKVEPAYIYGYLKTYEFYIDTNQPEKARQIIEQGIAVNPGASQQLQSILDKIKSI
ncbi:MAG: hypothetical protein HYW71_01670 [Candidatus Niyogibacteria bacterium]|nr:hypothetical protein [Candidatus Niyogibacteria bacterium]